MASDDSQIHVVPQPKEWDGKTYPWHCKTAAELCRAHDKINRRKNDVNVTRHHRRAGDIHVVRNREDTSKCDES